MKKKGEYSFIYIEDQSFKGYGFYELITKSTARKNPQRIIPLRRIQIVVP